MNLVYVASGQGDIMFEGKCRHLYIAALIINASSPFQPEDVGNG